VCVCVCVPGEKVHGSEKTVDLKPHLVDFKCCARSRPIASLFACPRLNRESEF
jgi:hypothetical protein